MPTHLEIDTAVRWHIEKVWPGRAIESFLWTLGRRTPNFQVYRVAPKKPDDAWVYISSGAWQAETREVPRYEFFLLSPTESPAHVETLAMLTSFHSSNLYNVEPGKIVDIGRAWMDGATCDHLLVSMPYPVGSDFEYLKMPNSSLEIRFLWLMPLTSDEAAFARENGVEAVEQKLEAAGANYLDTKRKSVIKVSSTHR